MPDDSPKVSVLIPNYNHARYLPERIASVLGQTFGDFEVLLMDDASTDNSRDVIPELIGRDKRVRLIYNETNGGSGYKQWNKGVREARGEYVWIAESDDWAEVRLLETLVGKLDAHPNVGVAYCQSWRVVEATGERYNNVEWTADFGSDRWERDFTADGKEECREYLSAKNVIPNASGIVFRRAIYNAVGGAPENYRLCADWLLWARMLLQSNVAFCAEPLNYFRLEPSSVTQKRKRDGTIAAESYDVALEIDGAAGLNPAQRERASDKMFYVWTHPQRVGDAHCSLQQNFAVYRKARRLDPRLNRRLTHLLARAIVEKNPILTPPLRRLRGVLGGRV